MADYLTRAQKLVRGLSVAEREFLRGLVAGESQRTIASRLQIEAAEVLALRQAVMTKLEAKCAADAVREGIYAGL